jgi:hypothetical protein
MPTPSVREPCADIRTLSDVADAVRVRVPWHDEGARVCLHDFDSVVLDAPEKPGLLVERAKRLDGALVAPDEAPEAARAEDIRSAAVLLLLPLMLSLAATAAALLLPMLMLPLLAAPALLLPGGPDGRREEETGCEEEEERDACFDRHDLLVASSGAGSGASGTVFVARAPLCVARWRGYVEGRSVAGERRVATSRGRAYPPFGTVRSSLGVACRGAQRRCWFSVLRC